MKTEQEKRDGQASQGDLDGSARRQPFDTRELAEFPQPTASDPPYRPWWIGADNNGDGEQA
jgi:hypothetical protein